MDPDAARFSYDTVAATYATKFFDELSRKPFDRELLELFADQCPGGRILDIGCGPGHIGRFLALYSLIHIKRADVPGALAEFKRVLMPEARLLVAVHGGTGEITSADFLGHQARFAATLFEKSELVRLVADAGFHVERAAERERYEFETHTPRIYVAATVGLG